MSWWGKLVGGAFGFMLGGPLGALLGVVLGQSFDSGLKEAQRADFGLGGAAQRERTQAAFFTATFSVMGHIAKADGRVTPDEIRLATAVMDHLSLSGALKHAAQRLFNEGRARGFALDDVLDQLRVECRRSRNLLRVFLEIQVQAAYADGHVHPEERRILEHICERLHLGPGELDHVEAMLQAEYQRQSGAAPATMRLADAYTVLGVEERASDAEVKKAYRRLMSRHHPDKLVARGLPDEMMKVATEKTQEVKAAYERVQAERKDRA